MKFNRFLMGVALSVIALSGCSNEEQLTLSGTADARTPLAISVTNAGLTKVGGEFLAPNSMTGRLSDSS